MFVLGVAGLILATAIIGGRLVSRTGNVVPAIWDIARVSATFTPIVGSLAGFSVASTIFLANLNVARESPEFPSLIGMFVIAFVLFVATAQEFGMTPNLATPPPPEYERLQRLSYLVAMFGYFVALAVSWNALRLLLLAIGLDSIADVFGWVLLVVVVAGATRLAVQHVYLLTSLSRASCLALPVLGFAAAGLFRLGLVPAIPDLAVPADEPFVITVACFAVATVGFALQSLVLTVHDHGPAWRTVSRHGERLVAAYLEAVTVVVALLWIAVGLA